MKTLNLSIALFLVSLSLMAAHGNKQGLKHKEDFKKQITYAPGEELVYSLNYGIFKGGEGRLLVKDTLMFGQTVHHVVATGVTVGLADALYRIRDRYESFIDPRTDLPVKSVRSIREGRYSYYNEVVFEHGMDSARVFSQRSGNHWVPANIQDILSAFYFARKYKFHDQLSNGEVVEIMTYFSDELFPLRIRYKGIEVIETALGKMECYVFSPVTEVGRAFKTEDDMRIWITRDQNRLPVRIKFNLKVGSFVCNLEQFRGLKNPFSSVVH